MRLIIDAADMPAIFADITAPPLITPFRHADAMLTPLFDYAMPPIYAAYFRCADAIFLCELFFCCC